MQDIKGIIFDIGGVLYVGDTPIEGAIEAISKIKRKYKVRFLTNSTRRPPKAIYKKLKDMGFSVKKDEIFTALSATKDYLKSKNAKIYPILTDEALVFMGSLVDENPKYVVVGDAYTNFTYERLNIAFRHLNSGAKLIATAKNRYFKDTDNNLSLDMGGFIKLLEYASNKKAKVIGKPNREFFNLAIKSMNLTPKEVIMVGDDIENDILGAQRANLKTVLVKSGKFKESDLKKDIKPDFIIDSVANLPKLLSLE